MKNKKLIISISIVFILLIVVGIYSFSIPTLISKSVQSTELGEVQVATYNCNFLCQILKPLTQTVYFSQSEFTASTLYQKVFNVGDTIYLYSRASCNDYSSSNVLKNDAKVITYIKNTNTNAQSSTTLKSNGVTNHAYFYVVVTVPANTVGAWKTWNTVECYSVGTTTPVRSSADYSNLARAFTVQQGTITCPTGANTGNKRFIPTSGYNDVSKIECEIWSSYGSAPSCTPTNVDKNCMTTCATNAFCDESYSSSTCTGQVSCVKQAQVCPEGTTGTYPNCELLTCPEGYTGTYPNCEPVASTDTCASNSYTCGTYNGESCGTCTSAQICMNRICVNTNPDISDDDIIDDDFPIGVCEDKVRMCGGSCPPCDIPSKINWVMIISIIVAIVFIVGLIIFLIKRRE